MKYILFSKQKSMGAFIGSIRQHTYWYKMYLYPDAHLLVVLADLQRIKIEYII